MATNQQYHVTLSMKKHKDVTANDSPVVIPFENIRSLTIKESVLTILPKLEMTIYDVGGILEVTPLLDNDTISITIAKTKEQDPLVECDFVLSDFNADSSQDNKSNMINLVGYLDAKEMFVPYKSRAFSGNTVDVLKTISQESGNFKFVNNGNTVDKMIWYQDSNNYDFIKHVVANSYIPTDTMFFYANVQNEMVYTSLFSEMDKTDVYTAEFSHSKGDAFHQDPDLPYAIYYSAYDIQNLQGTYNKRFGYGSGFVQYDLAGGVVSDLPYPRKKMTELFNKDSELDEKLVYKNTTGAIKSNPNVYEEYAKAKAQNENLRYDFFAQNISITGDGLSPIKLFDKVSIKIPSQVSGGTDVNDVFSGHYLVSDITHTLSYDNTYRKFLVLSRNGINKSSVNQEYYVN